MKKERTKEQQLERLLNIFETLVIDAHESRKIMESIFYHNPTRRKWERDTRICEEGAKQIRQEIKELLLHTEEQSSS